MLVLLLWQYNRKSESKKLVNHSQGRRYWGVGGGGWGGVTPPQNFKKSGKFGKNKGKFGQNNGKFCHKWQHLWLLVHPIKFGQFYKSRIFGQFNEHTPPIKVVSQRP